MPDLSCPYPDALPTPFFFADLYFKPNAQKGFDGHGVRVKVEWDGNAQPPAFKLR